MSWALNEVVARRGVTRSLRVQRVIPALLIIFSVTICWLSVAPREVGGKASYVITEGVSMLPKFEAGGLVITRSNDTYHVGDVAAYHNAELGEVVMHRIVAHAGNKYVLKGDNNNFTDHYRPTKQEILGKEWLYIPRVGGWLLWLRSPVAYGVTLALIALVVCRGPAAGRRRERHHGR